MKKNLLLSLLEHYNPTRDETSFKIIITDFVRNYENCFERSLPIGHITASSWLLNKEGSHALLMHHAKLNRWFQLGGHCDGNHDPLAVGIKEAQEESGIEKIVPVTKEIFDIDIHLIPSNSKEDAHFHYDIRFLLKVDSDEKIVQNRESKELRWIGKNLQDLPTDNPSVVRMFNKWISL
jgi:8-oxo-dGTP pyrophosphatase MutT (NUDIX family)